MKVGCFHNNNIIIFILLVRSLLIYYNLSILLGLRWLSNLEYFFAKTMGPGPGVESDEEKKQADSEDNDYPRARHAFV